MSEEYWREKCITLGRLLDEAEVKLKAAAAGSLASRLLAAEKTIEAQHAARNILAGDINLGTATLNKELQSKLNGARKLATLRAEITKDQGQPGESEGWRKLLEILT